MSKPLWRQMREDDLAAVAAIADVVHPGFFEAPEVLAEKLRLYPQGCFGLAGANGLVGYIYTHPWMRRALPALNRPIGTLPEAADSYYVHDLALLPEARGTGAAGEIVTRIAAEAREAGFAEMSLVAVNGSTGFWARQGFSTVELPELADKLLAYEPAARLMERRLV